MSMSDVEMWEKAVRWTLWCLMRQDLRQWSSDPQVQNLQTLKKAPTFWNTVSPYLPLWIQSCQKIAPCLFATKPNPPKFSLDALTTLASKHLTICEQSIVFCEAKLPLLMGNYVLEATDTMQMAFLPWSSCSMAVNSGKAFHTYDICQSALRLRRFERERERDWKDMMSLWVCWDTLNMWSRCAGQSDLVGKRHFPSLPRPHSSFSSPCWILLACANSWMLQICSRSYIYIYITFCPFCIQNALSKEV